jgi:hypothetical protein
MTNSSKLPAGSGRPCIVMAKWRFLTKSRLERLQAEMMKLTSIPLQTVLHPVIVVKDGLVVSDVYLDDTSCFEDLALQLPMYDIAGLGRTVQVFYMVDEAEDERVGAQLRNIVETRGSFMPSGDPRKLGPAYGFYYAMIDYPWRAVQLGTDPAVAEAVAALPKNDQPKLEARTLTPDGHRVFSFFQNIDAWHAYLDVVADMFDEQSVTATAYKIIDRAHEMSCDPLMDTSEPPPEPSSYWEPPGFESPFRPPE